MKGKLIIVFPFLCLFVCLFVLFVFFFFFFFFSFVSRNGLFGLKDEKKWEDRNCWEDRKVT